MSAQDVLVLADIQRDALADVTLELLAAARGLAAATGGQVVALVLSPDGASYAAVVGRGRPDRADGRSAVGRLLARAVPGSLAGGGRSGRSRGPC